MRDSLIDQIRQIASDLFNLPLRVVTPESSPETIEAWDSLEHVALVLSLEQAFAVQFRPEEVADIVSIEQAARVIEQKLAPRDL